MTDGKDSAKDNAKDNSSIVRLDPVQNGLSSGGGEGMGGCPTY